MKTTLIITLLYFIFFSCAQSYAGLSEEKKTTEELKNFEYFLELAKEEDAESQFLIAEFFDENFSIPMNKIKAAHWYKLSANQGYTKAQYNLAVLYQDGSGVPQSDAEAIKLYQAAALHGDIDAQYAMGYMHSDRDNLTALAWFKIAAEGGHEDAVAVWEEEKPLLDKDKIKKVGRMVLIYRQKMK